MVLRDQAAEGERLGGRPVEPLAALEHRLLGVEDPAQRLVDRQTFGDRGQHLADLGEQGIVDRGGDVAAPEHRLVGLAEPRPAALEPVGLVGQIADRRLELAFEQVGEFAWCVASIHAWSTTFSAISRAP